MITPSSQPDDAGEEVRQLRQRIAELEQRTAQQAQTIIEMQRLQQIVEQSANGVMLTDLSGNIEYVNPAFIQVTGYSSAEVIGRNPRFLQSGMTPPESYAALWKALRAGNVWRGEFANRRKNGEVYWEFAVIAPVRDSDGAITHYMAVKTEITRRKQTEEKLQALIDAFPDLLFLLRGDGTIANVYPSDSVPLYRPVEQVLGRRLSEVLPPDVGHAAEALIRTVLETGAQESGDYTLEIDGETRHFETRIAIFGPDEVLATICDVTARKQAEQHLRELIAERERGQLMKTFVTGAAHEFRTPLTIIGTQMHLLAAHIGTEAVARHQAVIEAQINNLVRLVDALLLLAQLDSATVLTREPVDVTMLLRNVRDVHQDFAAEHDVTIRIESEEPQIIQADPSYMQIALVQIIHNAIRFSQPGGCVTVRTENCATQVLIVVEDQGIGIKPEHCPRVFERFFRVDTAHSTRGLGLGLPVAQKAVMLHGGTITIDSTVGQGTTVYIRLPKEADPQP